MREESYELEEEKAQLVKDHNEYLNKLAYFVDDLLDSLNRVNPDTILDSDELVVKLERPRRTPR